MAIERPGLPTIRASTKIPVDGGSPEATQANKATAQQIYATRMRELAQFRYKLPTEKPTILFVEYRPWYDAQYTAHKRSNSPERSKLKQLGFHFDNWRLDQITPELILEWRSARQLAVSARTVNRELALLKHLLQTAVPRYLEANPARTVPALRAPERPIRILSEAEEDRLLKVAPPADQAWIVCALDTLQRLSAVGSLRRSDDHGAFLEFLNTKTKGRHRVPVSGRLRRLLDWLLQLDTDTPWLFPAIHVAGDTGWQVQKRIDYRFRELCAKAEIPTGRANNGVTFHCLRHTGASRMLTGPAKVDPKTVMEIGAWSSLKVFEKYLHPTDAQRQAAVEAVGQRESDVRNSRPPGAARGPAGTRPIRGSAQRNRPRRRPIRARSR
jgi:integrase